MNKIKYVCSICQNRKFSRKYNAQRHNDLLHDGAAFIQYSSNSLITKNKTTVATTMHPKVRKPTYQATVNNNFATNKYQNDSNYSPSSFDYLSPFTFSKPFSKTIEKSNYEICSNPSFLLEKEDEAENRLYNHLDKMIGPFEKLEKLLTDAPYLAYPYNTIDALLTNIIISALGKPDPRKFIEKQLASYTRTYYRGKMINHVAKTFCMNPQGAIEYLKMLL